MDVTLSPPADPVRWRFLDSLRGFALTGILFVNAVDITRVGDSYVGDDSIPPDPVRALLYLVVQSRLVPIFACLFGMSLWFVLTSARARAPRPWLAVVRRLVVLAVIGFALQAVYPGNILVGYGVVGLMVLPAVLFAPPRALLVAGAVLTIGITTTIGSNDLTDIGLMLLGAGAAGCGAPLLLERGGRGVVLVFGGAALAAAPLLVWQTTQPGDPRFTVAGPIAGLALAIVYSSGLALLWRTPLRRSIAAVFGPLGRMALSNYVAAAVIVATSTVFVPWQDMTGVLPVVLTAAVIIAAQSVVSRLWLQHFRYGPLEWAWRMATWSRAVPLRRDRRTDRRTPALAAPAGTVHGE